MAHELLSRARPPHCTTCTSCGVKRQSRTNSAQLELACCPRSPLTPTRLTQPPVSREPARSSRIMLLAGCGRERQRGPPAAYIFKVLRPDHQTSASRHRAYATSCLLCNGDRMVKRYGAARAPSVRDVGTFSLKPRTVIPRTECPVVCM